VLAKYTLVIKDRHAICCLTARQGNLDLGFINLSLEWWKTGTQGPCVRLCKMCAAIPWWAGSSSILVCTCLGWVPILCMSRTSCTVRTVEWVQTLEPLHQYSSLKVNIWLCHHEDGGESQGWGVSTSSLTHSRSLCGTGLDHPAEESWKQWAHSTVKAKTWKVRTTVQKAVTDMFPWCPQVLAYSH
jgi:hypothetical protein